MLYHGVMVLSIGRRQSHDWDYGPWILFLSKTTYETDRRAYLAKAPLLNP